MSSVLSAGNSTDWREAKGTFASSTDKPIHLGREVRIKNSCFALKNLELRHFYREKHNIRTLRIKFWENLLVRTSRKLCQPEPCQIYFNSKSNNHTPGCTIWLNTLMRSMKRNAKKYIAYLCVAHSESYISMICQQFISLYFDNNCKPTKSWFRI